MAHNPRLSMSGNLQEGGDGHQSNLIPPPSPAQQQRAGPTLHVPGSPSPTNAGGGGRKMSIRDVVRGSISAGVGGGGGGGEGGGGDGHQRRTRSASVTSSGAAIQNLHSHHYHYHLYQTTIADSGGGDKDDKDEEHDEQEDAEMAELMEMFPDGIPEELLSDDGSGVPQEIVDEQGNVITVIRPRQKAMKNIFEQHDLSAKDIESLTMFAKVYRFLHDPSSGWVARAWSILMVIAICTSSVMILMQSMPNLRFLDTIQTITYSVELYSVCLFTFDYLMKLFSVHSYADCVLPKDPGFNVTLRFMIQPLNLLDAASVVPFWVQMVLGDSATSSNTVSLIFRIVRSLRILRLLKVAQYSRSIDIFFRVIIQAWDALLLLLFFVGFGSIVFGTLIFLCEQGTEVTTYDAVLDRNVTRYMRPTVLGTTQEESPFTSIPQSFWFVITTLTTVGYGDMVPTSFLGKVVGGTTQLSGVLFISTPLVIFGTHFQNEFTKELERVAFVHKRQEKVKRRQQEKDRAAAQRAKEEADARVAAGGTRYGFDDTDPLAAAMGLGYDPTPLPGAVPPSPSVRGENGDMFSTPTGRTMTGFRGSTIGRGSTMIPGRTGSIMIGGSGSMGGDVAIRVNDSPGGGGGVMTGRGSIMPQGNNFLQQMTAMPSSGDSLCTCPCSCGARNAANSNMPGANNIAGGVRRSVISKNGSRMSIMNGGPFVSNPTAADNLAVSKGMQIAAAVLPPKEIAERSAQNMASQALTTQSSNMSAGNLLEMQAQMDSLRVMVAQLGGLLIAGGAPAPAIANAMMTSVLPPGALERSVSSGSNLRKGSINRARSGSVAEEPSSPLSAPAQAARGSVASPSNQQPASGKLMPKAAGPSTAATAGAIAGAAPPKPAAAGGAGASPTARPVASPAPMAQSSPKPAATGGAAANAGLNFSLPPAATTESAIPSPAVGPTAVEMVAVGTPPPLPSPSVLMSPVSSGGITMAEPFTPPPEQAVSAAAAAAAAVSDGPHPDVQAGPRPISVDQIIPARPRHTFPPAPSAEESVVETTQRMLGSMIDTPVLTEKLLSKPPFRFLHDIVTSMLRTRSWPEGYFDARECEPSNLVDLNSKLDFLEKLIDLLSIVNSVDLAHINPKKIVAGLEPDHTNQLLQEFAKAAASGITVPQITAMMEASEAGEPGTGVSYVPPPEVSPSPSPSAESVGAAEVAPGAGADAPLLGDAGAGASDAPSGSP